MNFPGITKNIVRLAVLVMAAFLLAAFLPPSADPTAVAFAPVAAVLFAAMSVLVLAQVTARRKRLFDAMRLELNKLRRLYHISKNLSTAAPDRYRGWFTQLHGFLYGYLTFFSGNDFDSYDGSNAAFRKLSYHVYTIPEIETRKQQALFDDLLRTTASIAEARQHIKELWDERITANLWLILLLLGGGFSLTAALAMGDSSASRLVVGSSFAAAFLIVDFLLELDMLEDDRKGMAKRYADNVAKLELGRREQ